MVTAATINTDRLIRRASEAARSGLACGPKAEAALANIDSRATVSLATAERGVERLTSAFVGGETLLIDQQDTLLQQAEFGLSDLDHTRMLGRGYALVCDVAGRVLTTQAAAEAA